MEAGFISQLGRTGETERARSQARISSAESFFQRGNGKKEGKNETNLAEEGEGRDARVARPKLFVVEVKMVGQRKYVKRLEQRQFESRFTPLRRFARRCRRRRRTVIALLGNFISVLFHKRLGPIVCHLRFPISPCSSPFRSFRSRFKTEKRKKKKRKKKKKKNGKREARNEREGYRKRVATRGKGCRGIRRYRSFRRCSIIITSSAWLASAPQEYR